MRRCPVTVTVQHNHCTAGGLWTATVTSPGYLYCTAAHKVTYLHLKKCYFMAPLSIFLRNSLSYLPRSAKN